MRKRDSKTYVTVDSAVVLIPSNTAIKPCEVCGGVWQSRPLRLEKSREEVLGKVKSGEWVPHSWASRLSVPNLEVNQKVSFSTVVSLWSKW